MVNFLPFLVLLLSDYTSFQKFWEKPSKNVIFNKFESLCQNLWAFMSNFGLFYHNHSPSVVKSRESGFKYEHI